MKAQVKKSHPETHAFCAVCGRPFTEAARVVADHSINFQCHHCWHPVRNVKAHTDSHYHTARAQGRVIPMAGKHRR